LLIVWLLLYSAEENFHNNTGKGKYAISNAMAYSINEDAFLSSQIILFL